MNNYEIASPGLILPDREPIQLEPNTEVVDQAFTWSGSSFREAIMPQVKHNAIRLIVPFGAPRAGKSTMANQLGDIIFSESEGEKRAIYRPFDDALKKYELKVGIPIANWGAREWGGFSVFHYSLIESAISETDENTIVIAEMVSIGKINRGITTLELVANNHPTDAFVVPVIGDPRIDEQDAARRLKVLEKNSGGQWLIPDGDLISFYASQGKDISGWINLTVSEAGAKLREAISRMDVPQGYRLWDLRDKAEVEKRSLEYSTNGIPEGAKRLPELDEILITVREQRARGEGRFHPIPEQIRDAKLDHWARDRFYTLLQYYWMLEQSGAFRKDRFIPAINLLIEGRQINYLDLSKLDNYEKEDSETT